MCDLVLGYNLLAPLDELVVHLVDVDCAVVLHQLLLVARRLLLAQLVLVHRRLLKVARSRNLSQIRSSHCSTTEV